MELAQLLLETVAARPMASLWLTLALVFGLHSAARLYHQRRFFKDLPAPPHSFFFGHLPVMGSISALFPPNTHPQSFFTEISHRYKLPGLYYLDLWPFAASQVVLSDPALIERANMEPFPKHKITSQFLDGLAGANNVASSNGHVWKRLHKVILPAFAPSHIRNLTDTIVEQCHLLRQKLDISAATGELVSMEEVMSKLTFDIAGRVVFNTQLHAQTRGGPLYEDLREMMECAHSQTDIVVQMNPIARAKLWWRKWRLLRRLNPALKAKVQERFEVLTSEGVTPKRKDPHSLLDLMLREKVSIAVQERNSLSIDYEEMLSNIKILLLAGHGTTTDTLCFMFMLLSKNASVVQRLRAEHSSVLGTSDALTIETILSTPGKLEDLPFTEGVIKESLRLFPLGFSVRGATTGTTLSVNGRSLPVDNGLVIALNGHGIAYNPDYFPNPTVFKPERWINDIIPKTYFLPFSGGPRRCPGQTLAMNEMKVILAMTMRKYDFECVGVAENKTPRVLHTDMDTVFGDFVFPELSVEAKPRGGMMMTVKKVDA